MMEERFKNLLSTEEISKATGRKQRWIQKIADELIIRGLAKYIGRALVCHADAIKYICDDRIETRGKTVKNRDVSNGVILKRVKQWQQGMPHIYPGGIVTLVDGLTFTTGTHDQKRGFFNMDEALSRISRATQCNCEDCKIARL